MHNKTMENALTYEWDDAKAEANLAKHDVAFDAMHFFEWETAVEVVDDRFDYGEERFIAYGFIGVRLHVCAYTMRGEAIRVISLRKANKKEIQAYEQAS